MPTYSIIAAMTETRVIGSGNDLPWDIPEDMKYFMKTTSGHPVVFGRATFESIPMGGKPLPKRDNFVITRSKDYKKQNVTVFHSLEEAFDGLSKRYPDREIEIFICGGAQIYDQALKHENIVNKIYLTVIHRSDIKGDAYFPEWDTSKFRELSVDRRDGFTFFVYQRI